MTAARLAKPLPPTSPARRSTRTACPAHAILIACQRFPRPASLLTGAATDPLLSLLIAVCRVANQEILFVRGKIAAQSALLGENCVGEVAAE